MIKLMPAEHQIELMVYINELKEKYAIEIETRDGRKYLNSKLISHIKVSGRNIVVKCIGCNDPVYIPQMPLKDLIDKLQTKKSFRGLFLEFKSCILFRNMFSGISWSKSSHRIINQILIESGLDFSYRSLRRVVKWLDPGI